MQHSSESFYISKPELDRRVSAYSRLCLSWLCGTVITLIALKQEAGVITIISIIILLIFILTRLLLIKFFNKYKDAKYLLTGNGIERFIDNKHEVYLFENIIKVKTIYTSNNLIKTIQINFNNKNSISVNALIDSKEFLNNLKENLNKEIFSKSIEPIDYDHQLFYILLGLCIGILSVLGFNFLMNQNPSTLKNYYLFSSFFSISLGIYFIISKPLSKYYGNKNWVSDFILGSILIIVGIIVLTFVSFN